MFDCDWNSDVCSSDLVMKIARPGKTMKCGATWYHREASDSMPPHVGVGGRRPTPRNDSAVLNMTFAGMSSVEYGSLERIVRKVGICLYRSCVVVDCGM